MNKLILMTFLVSSFVVHSVEYEGSYSPKFSPNGKYIAYHTNDEQSTWDIIIEDLTTGEKRIITNNVQLDLAATWSPDSNKIAFASNRTGGFDIYVYDLLTKTTQILINNEAWDAQPIWSPNGKTLAFTSKLETEHTQLYLYDFETEKQSRISFTDKSISHPNWSEDGKTIVFDQWHEGKSAIYALKIDTGKITKVYFNDANVMAASLVGSQLIAATNLNGNWDLIKVDVSSGQSDYLLKTSYDEDKTDVDPVRKRIAISQSGEDGIFRIKLLTFEQLGL